MKPNELTIDGFKAMLIERYGRCINLRYKQVEEITGYARQTLYWDKNAGLLIPQVPRKPVFDFLGIFQYMVKKGLV